jgi:chorismate mutase
MSASEARLEEFRQEIERIDRQLTQLIAERVRIARCIGDAKRTAGMATLDPEREAAVVRRAAILAREAGLDVETMRGIFWQLIGLSRRAQQEGP